jgi:uncharacterized protein (DUF4415 family)
MNPKRRKRPDPYLVDEDNPEWTEEMFRKARPAVEVVPEVVKAYRRSRGRPPKAVTKRQVTLRLSPEVLAFFRKQGRGWQTKIDEVLNRYVSRKKAA